MSRSPELKHRDLTQVPALPIGARLVVDPWDGRLELLRSAAALPGAMREKAPLAITPLTPHLRYANGGVAPLEARPNQPRASSSNSSSPVPRAADATPSPRNVEVPGQPAPQVPSLAPVPDLSVPTQGPTVPQIAPVPNLDPLPGADPTVPSLRDVPSTDLPKDLCEIEGTDAACSAGPR